MKRLPHRNRALLCALTLMVALLPACKKKEEAPAPATPAAPQPAPAPQAAPVQKQHSSAQAQGGGQGDFKARRDPFKPFLEAQPQKPAEQQGETLRPKGDELPIQSFEVSKFRVTGIIAGIKENRALLVDPQGKPYVVQVGMVVGNHQGRITRITPSSVEVVERYRDEAGHVKKRTIVLTLAKKR
ncbi:pilus assembly protein PilP [Geomonas sp. RF6]|uniref:pilus assembly protein PilP n=1 Tax=Geomonas sp. RF6 TaxID=2897342 RepID=UPI001E2A669D|nr:pilus assembly protein PilP [Geomonas sp. RF6]UFS69650.1 pilus assembly protein PilP [Geomonas sp. RF6]